jgi:hypothetical protein
MYGKKENGTMDWMRGSRAHQHSKGLLFLSRTDWLPMTHTGRSQAAVFPSTESTDWYVSCSWTETCPPVMLSTMGAVRAASATARGHTERRLDMVKRETSWLPDALQTQA